MVEYIKPIRPNAAPTKMIDSYYRPLLDNRESQALSKLASAIGNLRGPIQDLANTAVQARRNQLQMMKMEQNLQLQEQENAFKLYKMEQDFALTQARDNYSDTMDAFKAVNSDISRQIQLDQLRMENGLPVYGTDTFVGTSAGKVTMVNEEAIRNKPLDDELYGILSSAAAQTGLEVRVFSGGQDGINEGTRRTGSQRHDHGNAADVHLIDQETGKIIPVDGSDPRALKFAQVARGLGIRGMGGGADYMGGNALHLDTVGTAKGGGNYWGKKGGTPYAWIPELFNSNMSDNIKEYTASESVQYTMAMNARRTSLLNQVLVDRGISEETRARLMQSVERDNAFALEKAMIMAEVAERKSQMTQYEASRDLYDAELAERFKAMSSDQLLSTSNEDLLDNLAGMFAQNAADQGFDMGIVADVNNADSLMGTSAFKTLAALRGEAFAENARAVKASDAINAVAEFQQQVPEADAEVIAQVYREEVAKTGLAPEEIARTFVSNVELAQMQAAASGATVANIENARVQTAALDALFQANAFAGVGDEMAKKIGSLVKADAENRVGNTLKAFQLTLKQTDNPEQIKQFTLSTLQAMQPLAETMSVSEQEDLFNATKTAATTYNSAQSKIDSDPNEPVRETKGTATVANGVLSFNDDYRMTSSEVAAQKTNKQNALIREDILPALDAITAGDQNGHSNLAAAINLAKRNGYSEGLMARVFNEMVGDGEVTTDTIATVERLVQYSKQLGDPYIDFAGNPELQILAMSPQNFSVAQRQFGNMLTGGAITDDHIATIQEAVGSLGVNDARFEAVLAISNNLDTILAKPNDPDAVQRQIDRLARNVAPKELYGAFGDSLLGQGTATRAFAGEITTEQMMKGVNVLGLFAERVSVLSTDSIRDLTMTTHRLDNNGMKGSAALGTRVLADLFGTAGVELKNIEQNAAGINVTMNSNGFSLSRADGQAMLYRDDFGNLAPLGRFRTQVVGGKVPMQAVNFSRPNNTAMQGKTTHLLVEGLAGQTWDIRNVRGALTVTATFADGTAQDFAVSPDDFLAIDTRGRDFDDSHGLIAYMLPYEDKFSNATSIELRMDGDIGYAPPNSTDFQSAFFHMDTIVPAWKLGQSPEQLTILGGN